MRKGQAAMEFLMTYGWAILVVLAAIGALAYFGVLSPERFLPDKCTVSPPFSTTCGEYKVSASNGLTIGIPNNGGKDLTVNSLTLSCDSGASSSAPTSGFTADQLLLNGNSLTPVWATGAGAELEDAGCGAALVSGAKFKATFTLVYTNSGETTNHTSTGSIQARVED